MTKLITLEGKAQQKGKKVTGYKFPDNLDDLKFPFKLLFHPNSGDGLNDNKNAKIYVKLVKNERGYNLQSKEGDLLNLSKNSFDRSEVVISTEKISSDSATNTNKIIAKESKNTSSKKYKILKTNKFSEPPFKVGDIVEGTLDSNGFLIVNRDFEGKKDVQFQFGKGEFKEIKQDNASSNSTLEEDLNNSILGKTARKIQIGFTVVGWGVFGILAYKFWNKSTTWKVMLSAFGAYNLYSTYKVFSKPALKVEGGSKNESNSNLTKSQKIDLIVKNMSDPEQKGLDVFNKKFISTLNDTELNTWLKLSKALKDSDLKKQGESGNKGQLYKLLSSKYQISQNEFDSAMKKYGEAMMGDFEKGMTEGLTNAMEQVYEEGATQAFSNTDEQGSYENMMENENSSFIGRNKNNMFSNFESNLDLDI
jgi:hypothetical protein